VESAVAYWPAAVILPATLAVGALASGYGPKLSRPVRNGLAWVLGGAAALGLLRWQLGRLFVDTPAYELEKRIGKLDVRRYPAVVQAETTVLGEDWDDALSEGFRRLATYISGDNTHDERIRMTAPVWCSPKAGERLEMTSPTSLEAASEGQTVAFIMPEGRTWATLPQPNDLRVSLRSVPSRRIAALRHSGRSTDELIRAKWSRLLALVEQAGLTPTSAPAFAGYDPPSTLPFLRRLEVWVEVA
jgi:hypothetical protein